MGRKGNGLAELGVGGGEAKERFQEKTGSQSPRGENQVCLTAGWEERVSLRT